MERLIKEMEGDDESDDEDVKDEDLDVDDELNEDFPIGPLSDDEDADEKELQEMVRIFREDVKKNKKPIMKARRSMVRV